MYQPESWLCAICMQVVQPKGNGLDLRNSSPDGQTLERFRKAAAGNCFICSRLWNLSGQHRQAWDGLTPQEWNPFRYIVDREEYEGKLHQIRLWVVFSDPTREQSEQATDIRFRLIPSVAQESTGSSATLDLAYSWFHKCASHHNNRCKNLPISTEGWLPSRLLDVGSHEDTHWKLLVSATDVTESPTPAYLTLSYRWGTGPQHAILSSSTIDQYRRGTQISDLPQTFQDLVLIARHFGIRYVWIDCFCIIQDSRDDWEAEAPMMRHIYANAACNIAASASDSPNGGLFRSRDVRDIQPGIISTTLASELPQKFYMFDKSYWDRELLAGSLHRRGWVFQERFLGPRQLYFTRNQVLWECLEEHKCEGFPHGIPLHDSSKSIDRLLGLPGNTETMDQRQKKDNQAHLDNSLTFEAVDLWCDLVTTYSRCHFTYSEDKLYAFTGVTKLFQEVTGDRHLAGIWQSRILHLLNWTVFTPKSRCSARYRAPSWSWASIDGPVKMRKPAAGFEFLVAVADVDVTTKKEGDDTAEAVGGYINLRGVLFTANYTQESTDGPLLVQLGNRDICSFNVWPFPDTTETRFERLGTIHFLVLKSQEIYYQNPEQSAEGENIDLICLILAPASELDGIYKRIGWFSLRQQGPVATLLAACKEEPREIIIV
ncbi:heterokaryon incompatibility protein [Colletotrichum tofieldiae]|uniref:Heterokaryon incompatibility protein n=1 Tax=Colletotrichum tofieldiae TaxID=708197 RepID=A0A166T727_9PEZI|nr:heterokaryon incompatibility protein [Colletotrichum tofieldiae]